MIPLFNLAHKDGDMGINSPVMWLRGDIGDQGIQSINFQGYGLTPWMQPRIDASILGLQSNMQQAVAAASLQELRSLDPSKHPAQSLLQFQQPQNVSSCPASLFRGQVLHHTQSRQAFLQSFQENPPRAQAQAQLLQQQLQGRQSYYNQQPQQQLQQTQQLHRQLSDQQHIPKVISSISELPSPAQSLPPSLKTIPSPIQPQIFPNSVGNPITAADVSTMQSLLGSFSQDGTSHLLNLHGSNPVISSSAFFPKQVTVEPQLTSGAIQCILPQVEELATPASNVSELSTLLPPFPGREYSVYQSIGDPQNNLLFGVNIDSSSLALQNGMSNLRSISSENDSVSMPFSTSNFASAPGNDFPLNSDMTTSSCIDESGFLQSSENMEQVNPPTRTFVKVNGAAIIFYEHFSLSELLTFAYPGIALCPLSRKLGGFTCIK